MSTSAHHRSDIVAALLWSGVLVLSGTAYAFASPLAPTELTAIAEQIDCSKCMPHGKVCDLVRYWNAYPSKLTVAIVKRPKFKGYVLDHACPEKLLGEPCSEYWNILLYSFPEMTFIVNGSGVKPHEELSARYTYTPKYPERWTGIYLRGDSTYVIALTGERDTMNSHKAISLACAIRD